MHSEVGRTGSTNYSHCCCWQSAPASVLLIWNRFCTLFAASFPASREQVLQQGTVADLVTGFIAPEAAASSAPSAGGADCGGSAVLLLPLPDEEKFRLLLGLRGYGLVEDVLPRMGVVCKLEGLRAGVRLPVQDSVGCHLVVEADHEDLDQVGVCLVVGRRHVGVGPGVEEPQAGGPGKDWLVLLLGGLAEGDPGDVETGRPGGSAARTS